MHLAKLTSSGVTGRVCKARTSRRLRLCSRRQACAVGVGRGGKGLRLQFGFEGLGEAFLVSHHGHHVIRAAFKSSFCAVRSCVCSASSTTTLPSRSSRSMSVYEAGISLLLSATRTVPSQRPLCPPIALTSF